MALVPLFIVMWLVLVSITVPLARESWMEGSPLAYTQAVILTILLIVLAIAIGVQIGASLQTGASDASMVLHL